MQQLLRPGPFGAEDYLLLAIGEPELTIDGLDQRARELVALEFIAHGLSTLFKREVPLLHQLLWGSYEGPLLIGEFLLPATQEFHGQYLLAMLQPPFDNLILSARAHPCHAMHL